MFCMGAYSSWQNYVKDGVDLCEPGQIIPPGSWWLQSGLFYKKGHGSDNNKNSFELSLDVKSLTHPLCIMEA